MCSLTKILRVLVIDDKVGASDALQEYVCSAIYSLALTSPGGQCLDYVDVQFAPTPNSGASRWQKEWFDLTLIDSHFEPTNEEKKSKTVGTHALVLDAKYQGLILYGLLASQMADGERLAYRREAVEIAVWSSLDESVLKEHPGTAQHLTAYHAKVDATKLRNTLGRVIARICLGEYKEEQARERALTFIRLAEQGVPRSFAWPREIKSCRWLVLDRESDLTYLPAIWSDKSTKATLRMAARFPKNRGRSIVYDLSGSPLTENRLKQSVERGNLAGDDLIGDLSSRTVKGATPQDRVEFIGFSFPRGRFAAATPLTGITVAGRDKALTFLVEKVQALLASHFGAVILKTAYLNRRDEWTDVYWPSIQVQSHMRARCLYPSTGLATLWNTGRTALEMFTPEDIAVLLGRLAQTALKEESHRVIVSLGSKFHHQGELKRGYEATVSAEYGEIWSKLFSRVFGPVPEDDTPTTFPLVEINVRHFLREIVKYYLGGDEYLNPTTIGEKCSLDYESFWKDLALWLEVVHNTAVQWRKLLILKMPHRSDTLSLVRYAVSLRKRHRLCAAEPLRRYGVRAVTLVNALKTPAPPDGKGPIPFTPPWYSDAATWGDADEKTGKYQMSGGYLAPYRDQILSGMLRRDMDDVEVMLSGGVVGKLGIDAAQAAYAAGKKDEAGKVAPVQIGTWALLGYSYVRGLRPAPIRAEGQWEKTGLPFETRTHELAESAITPRLVFIHESLCQGCGKCVSTHYCDAFLERAVQVTPARKPRLDPRNCTGCGLCVQICPEGALQLYRPADIIVLVDHARERSALLSSLGVPHIRLGADALAALSNTLVSLGGPDVSCLDVFLQRVSAAADKSDLRSFLLGVATARVGTAPSEYGRDQFCLRQDKEKVYKELRYTSLHQPSGFVGDTLSDLACNLTDPLERLAAIRAAVWAMLVWTDPGQVLLSSPLLCIKTDISDRNGVSQIPTDATGVEKCLKELQGRPVTARSAAAMVRWDESGPTLSVVSHSTLLQVADRTNWAPYVASGMGVGRLCGLDIRGAGRFLFSNYDDLSDNDVLSVAGLPWHRIVERFPAIQELAGRSAARMQSFKRAEQLGGEDAEA